MKHFRADFIEERASIRLVHAFPAANCNVDANEELVRGSSVAVGRRTLRRGMHRNRPVNKDQIVSSALIGVSGRRSENVYRY